MTRNRPALAPLLCLLLALLMRAGIPAGYMLAPGDGLPRIVPCGITAPAAHHGQHHGKGQPEQPPCPFALTATAGPPEPAIVLPAPITAEAAAAPSYPVTAGAPDPASTHPPATGPPAA